MQELRKNFEIKDLLLIIKETSLERVELFRFPSKQQNERFYNNLETLYECAGGVKSKVSLFSHCISSTMIY
jgi:hypothetical protein